MTSEPYRECWCRDPDTKRPLRRDCRKLGQKGHGAWASAIGHDAPIPIVMFKQTGDDGLTRNFW
jgi:hypothetical protein